MTAGEELKPQMDADGHRLGNREILDKRERNDEAIQVSFGEHTRPRVLLDPPRVQLQTARTQATHRKHRRSPVFSEGACAARSHENSPV